MNVILFGATGMIGQGLLRECLNASDVTLVQTVGRKATGEKHPKLRELVCPDLLDYRGVETELQNFDACFFCLGVSAAGMTEAEYSRVTHDITLAAAETLARLNPQMTFIYVSGAGTDSSEKGRIMWARVKGRTENGLLKLPFKSVYMFRPGIIQPLHGARSRTRFYRVFYTVTKPILPLVRALMPKSVLTTESIAQAMLTLARGAAGRGIMETTDISALVGDR